MEPPRWHLVLALLLSFCCHFSAGDVLIGEVLHASHYQKRVTLRNTGLDSEPLFQYTLTLYMNPPGPTVYRFNPISATVVLRPSEEFSICHTSSPESCDVKWGGLNFNGNDVIELAKNGNPVDVVGDYEGQGVVAGGWTVGDTVAATRDHLLTRKSSVRSGNLDWKTSSQTEWTVQSARTITTGSKAITSTAFDDGCWPLRSRLSSFQLDACDVPADRGSVAIGTYNVEFLFDGVDDPAAQDAWKTPTQARRHLEAVAAVIRQHKPDILNLAEVEDMAILKDLVREIGDPVYTPYLIRGKDTYTKQDVALITQGDFLHSMTRTDCRSGEVSKSHCGSSLSRSVGVSKNQIALFDSCLFGWKFALVGVHFYAHPTDKQPCIQRESQARVMQDVITQLIGAGFEVIVAGDLNDFSDKYEDVHPQLWPKSRVLSMLRDPNGDGIDELDNVMQFLPRSQRYTAWWDSDSDDDFPGPEEASEIDHILMTKRLFERIQRVWIDHKPNPETVSDHWPLFVELSTKELPTT